MAFEIVGQDFQPQKKDEQQAGEGHGGKSELHRNLAQIPGKKLGHKDVGHGEQHRQADDGPQGPMADTLGKGGQGQVAKVRQRAHDRPP